MKIFCPDFAAFMAVIADCVKRGLGFAAYADRLVIELTGSH